MSRMELMNLSSIDVELERILDQHDKQLDKHEQKISKLEETTTKILVQQAEMSIKLSSIEAGQADIKKSITENALAQRRFENDLINKLVDKNSENQTRMWDFGFKVLALLGTVLGIISLVIKWKIG